MTEERKDVPSLDLTIAEKAARRSRTGGAWSLGHLTVCWAALLITGAALVIAGAIASGSRAALGGAIGTMIVGLFFTVSAVVIAKAGQRNPKLVLAAALGTYVVKIFALGVVLVVIPADGAIDTHWMAGAVALGLLAWMGAHLRYVWTTKLFYVDPS